MKKNFVISILLIAILFLLPFVFPDYWILIVSEILIMGFFAISFNLLLGYSGLLSFGHAGFFGIGAYTAALLLQHNIESLFLIFIAGFLLSGIAALIIGFLSVKHDEIYFAMITLAFGMMLFTIAHNWTSLTGGSDGLPLMSIPSIKIFGHEYSLFQPGAMYYLILFITSISTFFLYRLVNSHFGLILTGMRENKNRLNFSGANIRNIRLFAFVISSSFSGIAGVLFCLFSSMATPESLHWSFSAKPVIMSIIGGTGVFLGPLVGSGIFYLLEQLIRQFTDNWMIFLGFVLIPIVLFFPEGILGTIIFKFTKRGGKTNE